MTDINVIAPLLEKIAKLCRLEFQVFLHGRSVLKTISFCTDFDESAKEAAMARFAPHAEPFQIELPPHGVSMCGVPLNRSHGTRDWLLATVPDQHSICTKDDVMPLLRTLTEVIKERGANKNEIDKLASELAVSYEELSLYSRIQKSFHSKSLSSSELDEILKRLKDVLHADLVFCYFSSIPDLNITVSDQGLVDRIDMETFVDDILKNIIKARESINGDHFIVNNSSNEPLFASISPRPFRLMAARAVCNDHEYGWLGIISFNFYTSFKHRHLNLLNTVASQAASAGANNHLMEGLEALTAQVRTFKKELNSNQDRDSAENEPACRQSGDFLESAFTNLSESIEAAKRMVLRSARMATMGQLASVFAHEIKQPVCALEGFIQIAELKQNGKGPNEDIKMMGKAVHRIINTIKRFDSLSRPMEQQMRPLSLNHIVQEVFGLVKPQLLIKQIHGSIHEASDLPDIMGDAQGLQQAVLNLVSNAIQSMESDNGRSPEIQLKTSRADLHVCLDVIDKGPGIPQERIGKLVQPYYTTKPKGKGTGLGLSVVSDIVEQHNGRLEIESLPGRGSRFTIKIPIPKRSLKDVCGRLN